MNQRPGAGRARPKLSPFFYRRPETENLTFSPITEDGDFLYVENSVDELKRLTPRTNQAGSGVALPFLWPFGHAI